SAAPTRSRLLHRASSNLVPARSSRALHRISRRARLVCRATDSGNARTVALGRNGASRGVTRNNHRSTTPVAEIEGRAMTLAGSAISSAIKSRATGETEPPPVPDSGDSTVSACVDSGVDGSRVGFAKPKLALDQLQDQEAALPRAPRSPNEPGCCTHEARPW